MRASPLFLVIGHLAKDLHDGGFSLGGSVVYAGLAAGRLGYRVGVLTRAEPELRERLERELADTAVCYLPSARTTTFRNRYEGGRRRQQLLAVADPIGPGDLPAEWRSPPIVLLAPLFGEIDTGLATMFPSSLLGVAAQGWLRRRSPDGSVRPARWQGAREVLRHATVVVLSEEDAGGDRGLVEEYARETKLLVLTEGPRGATVFQHGRQTRYPGFPTSEVDPTGAGDVFAAAFLIAYHETGDAANAARFANCAASFVVEDTGTAGVPTRAQVEDRRRRMGDPPASAAD